jgi:hypothetical protein
LSQLFGLDGLMRQSAGEACNVIDALLKQDLSCTDFLYRIAGVNGGGIRRKR